MCISVGVHEPGDKPFGSAEDGDSTGGENGSASSIPAGDSTLKKVKNTLIWIDESGAILNDYNKLHMFDMDIEGGPVIRESR